MKLRLSETSGNSGATLTSHQRPLFVYAGALVIAAALSLLLPGRHKKA